MTVRPQSRLVSLATPAKSIIYAAVKFGINVVKSDVHSDGSVAKGGCYDGLSKRQSGREMESLDP